MCAVAPSGVGENLYYGTQEEYLAAVADALHTEYQAIVDDRGGRPPRHRPTLVAPASAISAIRADQTKSH